MESEGQVTTSEEIEDVTPQVNNNCGASASNQVKWKKDMLTDMEPIEEKQQTSKAKISVNRPCKEHSFLTDVADVRMMEQGLLQLLDDFHSGKLQAFGVDSSCEKMDQIREQQERLARLHFDLDLQQDLHRLDTDTARKTANDNLGKLIDQLQCLSTSINGGMSGLNVLLCLVLSFFILSSNLDLVTFALHLSRVDKISTRQTLQQKDVPLNNASSP